MGGIISSCLLFPVYGKFWCRHLRKKLIMKQLKFILPATLLFFSYTLFAQVEKSVIPPPPPGQPAPPPLPPPPPPPLKAIKKHNQEHFKKFKEAEPARKPAQPMPPPPPPALPEEE